MEARQQRTGALQALWAYLTFGGWKKKQRRTGKKRGSFPIILILLSLFSCTAFSNTIFVADRERMSDNYFRHVDIFHVDANHAISYIKPLSFTVAGDSLDWGEYGFGPMDLAIDEAQQTIFVSFETRNNLGTLCGTCKIALIDFNTLTHNQENDFVFPQGNDIGGLCYDPQRQQLYGIERNTSQVYVLKWNPQTRRLTYQQLIHLSNIQYACALQIDGDMAYVSEYYYSNQMQYFNHIKQYDISRNWAYVRTIPNGDKTTCLAYDSQREIFYSGAYDYSNTYRHIIKNSLLTNQIIVKSNTGCMIDGQVDETSGYLYLTAYRGGPSDPTGAIEIWNTSGWSSNPNQGLLATYDNASVLAGPAGILFVDHDPNPVRIGVHKEDGLDPNNPSDWVLPNDTITYTITIDPNDPNVTNHDWMTVVDHLPAGVNYEPGLNSMPAPAPAPADPNIIFGIADVNGLDEITLNIGQSARLYVTKQMADADIYAFNLEAAISDPNLGWIDNTEYDPNDPNASTAEILATPRNTLYDYYGPGYTEEGILFSAVSFSGAMEDGDLASFIYTPTQPGYVTLTLVNYDTIPATLEEIVICQVDPNDPNTPNTPPAAPPAGVYDSQTHTVTWNLGPVSAPVTLTLTVRVNNKAEPMGLLVNEVTATSNVGFGQGFEQTQVGCFGGNIIYVDITADEGGNGTSWNMAYQQLSDALKRAAKGCGVDEVWVAQGTYSPGPKVTDTFEVPAGKSIYGGFVGSEPTRDQRNPKLYPTVLSGYIRTLNNIEERNDTVVTMRDETFLDGVIVERGYLYGIYGSQASFTLKDCYVQENNHYGLFCQSGNVEITQTSICDNGWDGIYHSGSSSLLTMKNCTISNNQKNGINCSSSTPMIINSVIYHNSEGDSIDEQYYSVKITDSTARAVLRNNTIVYNQSVGVYYSGNSNLFPIVKNCILWLNVKFGQFKDKEGFTQTVHSCLTDPNHPYLVIANPTPDSSGNIITAPKMAYADPNLKNFHLAYDSPCVNAGDPNETDTLNETDMDGEIRVYGASVEIGADEVFSCDDDLSEDDIYNACDWNADGIVNYADFSMLSHAWLTSWNSNPNLSDPNYNPLCDLNHDAYVDTQDLALFIPEWLWAGCWRLDIQEMQQQMAQPSMMSMSSSLMTDSTAIQSEPITEQPASLVFTQIKIAPIQEAEVQSMQAEVVDPAVEQATILSLIKDINTFIDAGGEDAEAWQEMKIILKQSLVDIEDMINGDMEI